MAAQVAPLCEALLAFGADEGPLARVFAEVVPKIAAFLKNGGTPLIATLEVELHSHRAGVAHLNGLVPVLWDALVSLRLIALRMHGRQGLYRGVGPLVTLKGEFRFITNLISTGINFLCLRRGFDIGSKEFLNSRRFFHKTRLNSLRLLLINWVWLLLL